jgi:hypothetical protein
MAPKKQETAVEVPKLKIQTVELHLVGTSPLVVHAWSEKAKQQMRDKQGKKAKQGKEAKVPAHDFADALYWLTEKPTLSADPEKAMAEVTKAVAAGRFGFPTVAFKAAAVAGAGFVDGLTKVGTRGAFHIRGEFVEIESTPPVMREDMVRVGMGTADLRYRPMFEEWGVTLTVDINSTAMSAEQVVNLFNIGGFACGVGEYRPERDGSWGRFTVK